MNCMKTNIESLKKISMFFVFYSSKLYNFNNNNNCLRLIINESIFYVWIDLNREAHVEDLV